MKKIYCSVVLDRSSSMTVVERETVDGFNKYLSALKEKESTIPYYFFLTMFNSDVQEMYSGVRLEEVKPLNSETYYPAGSTALYDAVMKTIEKMEKRAKKNPCLMVIITDGQENSSVKFTDKQFAKKVEALKEKGNWTFVFLGANQDSWATTSHLNFDRGNVQNFDFSKAGVKKTWESLALNTQEYYGGVLRGQSASSNFFVTEKSDTSIPEASEVEQVEK